MRLTKGELMKSFIAITIVVCLLSGCVSAGKKSDPVVGERPEVRQQQDDSLFSQGPGRNVLSTARKMVNIDKKVVSGSCWDWVNAVFERAGYPEKKRQAVYMAKEQGPFADISQIKPGDWILHHNLEYPPYTHSSIFVKWIDRGAGMAETMDYAGLNRQVPGKVAKHSYTKVFGIIRAIEK